ncbi:DUF7882 family protein [Agromyces indicus]|uniref:DUF7882 domain-containing protein n=1 Tax=Agromyces indicus TaxID=758919 RepID=A0ABU1FLM2_9MICO|nr:hypothetical protein [Agromyces indicus]MDR5692652.1 hypothetical protein [Agromyces indicus]
MGKLYYGDSSFEMEDRLLAHLQLIIGVKLRRGENFFMSWRAADSSGLGRHAVWVDNGVPIHCEYDASVPVELNMAWAERLADLASKGGGLIIQAEDVPLGVEEVDQSAHSINAS